VRQIYKAALPFAGQMEGGHFPPGFLQQMANLADELDASVAAKDDVARRAANATKAVRDALREGRAAVQTLDSIVSHIILGNAPLEAEWRGAKRIVHVGVVKKVPQAQATMDVKAA